jgi:hypothetical protein
MELLYIDHFKLIFKLKVIFTVWCTVLQVLTKSIGLGDSLHKSQYRAFLLPQKSLFAAIFMVILSPHTLTLATTGSVPIPMLLPFPKCHRHGIIQ